MEFVEKIPEIKMGLQGEIVLAVRGAKGWEKIETGIVVPLGLHGLF